MFVISVGAVGLPFEIGSPAGLQAELQALDATLLQTAANLKDPSLLAATVAAAGSLLYVFLIATPRRWSRLLRSRFSS